MNARRFRLLFYSANGTAVTEVARSAVAGKGEEIPGGVPFKQSHYQISSVLDLDPDGHI